GSRQSADRRLNRVSVTLDSTDHPFDDPAVLAETGPEEAPRRVLAEPVDLEDTRQLFRRRRLTDLQPVGPVVRHVVATERQHGEWVTTQRPNRPFGRRRLLR